jgi:hypothetical protein
MSAAAEGAAQAKPIELDAMGEVQQGAAVWSVQR